MIIPHLAPSHNTITPLSDHKKRSTEVDPSLSIVGTIFHGKTEKEQKNGSKAGILALKTQKRTPKSQTNQRSGLARIIGFNT